MAGCRNSGIVGWGVYIPKYRIKATEIASVWGFGEGQADGIWVEEKAVGNVDEDATTIGYSAALNAMRRAYVDPKDIDAVYFASESKPYAVKPSATIIAEALKIASKHMVADLEFACRAVGEGLRLGISHVEAGQARYVLVVGSDTAQSNPGDVLELTASCAGAAFVIGPASASSAVFEGVTTYSTDTPDFWRREGAPYPVHGEGFTCEPAYFHHIVTAARMLMEELGLRPSDFDYAVFHQPNGRLPLKVASMLGMPKEKVLPGLVAPYIGNSYNGAMPIGLARLLELARPGQRILAVSYGSGAGSDAFSLVVTDRVIEVANRAPRVDHYLNFKEYVNYSCYLKMRCLINRYHV